MTNADHNGESKELKFIRLYRELTGADEAQARSVFMHVGCKQDRLDWDDRDWSVDQTASTDSKEAASDH